MPLSSYARNKALDQLFSGQTYVSAHTEDPGLAGANEVAGGSYARQAGGWDATLSGTKASNVDVFFPDMPKATITHLGVWDAATAGNFLWSIPLSTPKATGVGDALQFKAGKVSVTLQ